MAAVTGGQGATGGIDASFRTSSPLPDELSAPGVISFRVSCRFGEDQSAWRVCSAYEAL